MPPDLDRCLAAARPTIESMCIASHIAWKPKTKCDAMALPRVICLHSSGGLACVLLRSYAATPDKATLIPSAIHSQSYRSAQVHRTRPCIYCSLWVLCSMRCCRWCYSARACYCHNPRYRYPRPRNLRVHSVLLPHQKPLRRISHAFPNPHHHPCPVRTVRVCGFSFSLQNCSDRSKGDARVIYSIDPCMNR